MRVVPASIEQRWMALSGNLRGALWMVGSGVIFTFMAIAIKLLGHSARLLDRAQLHQAAVLHHPRGDRAA
jgi:hypothetical protein